MSPYRDGIDFNCVKISQEKREEKRFLGTLYVVANAKRTFGIRT